jgi:ribosomal protein S6--L-glutamate ligase
VGLVVHKKVLLLFGKGAAKEGKAYPKELAQLLSQADERISVSFAFFEDLLFAVNNEIVDVVDTVHELSLLEYDVVYFRHWGEVQGAALAAARFCELKKIPFIDSEVLRQGSFNKITQYMNLHESGVSFPRTLIAPGPQLLTRYAQYGFDFPLVLKSVSGTRGQDNYVVRNELEMRHVLEDNATLTFVLQEFIPNEGDYRVVVMGNKVVMAIKRRAAEKNHLNNTSQGGSAELVAVDSLPQQVLEASVRAAAFFGRQVAGVDMVQSKSNGHWYCFEVNRSPQIEHASFQDEKAIHLSAYLHDIAK